MGPSVVEGYEVASPVLAAVSFKWDGGLTAVNYIIVYFVVAV